MNEIGFFVTRPLSLGYVGAIYVDVREKKRESVDIGNCNYRKQRAGKIWT